MCILNIRVAAGRDRRLQGDREHRSCHDLPQRYHHRALNFFEASVV